MRPSGSPAVALLAAALVLLTVACNGEKQEARQAGPKPVAVRAAPVTVGDLTLASEHPGELFADAVEAAPRLSGTLVAVPVRLGDRVKKGDVVARIDDAEIAHQIQEAAAAAAAAEANAQRAQAELDLARTERARKAPLAEDELVSAQEMSELGSRVASLEAQVSAARAQADQWLARVRLHEEQRKDTRIVAPFDAVVAERRLDPGATVGPSTPILRLVAAGAPRVRFRVPERALAVLREGLPIEVRTAASGERAAEGRVERIGGEVSRTDRSVQVEAVLEESPLMKPGMYATVRLREERLEDVLLVPSEAVLSRLRGGREEQVVFVAEDGRARMVPVALLGKSGNLTAVRGGLSTGMRVLTLGHEDLSDGGPIRVVEAAQSTPRADAGERG